MRTVRVIGKKKILAIGIVILVLTGSISINASYVLKKDLMEKKYHKKEMFFISDFLNPVNSSNNHTIKGVGLIKVESWGKGLHVIWPLKIIKINAPIPTPQYPSFLPINLQFFIVMCVYNHETAYSNITFLDGRNVNITGPHTLIMGMFNSPTLWFLAQLLDHGMMDGIKPLSMLLNNVLKNMPKEWQDKILKNMSKEWRDKGPVMLVITKMIDYITKKFDRIPDYPFIDIKNETYKWLREAKGIPPMYRGQGPYMFNETFISNLNQTLYENRFIKRFIEWYNDLLQGPLNQILPRYDITLLNNSMKLLGRMVLVQMLMFWNRMMVRVPLMGFNVPIETIGYAPFVFCSLELPTGMMNFVNRVDDFFKGRVLYENIPPIADADGPYHGELDENNSVKIVFDASKSYDEDGRVVKYKWDFNDDGEWDIKTSNSTVKHVFNETGEYFVTLEVVDDKKGRDKDKTLVVISKGIG